MENQQQERPKIGKFEKVLIVLIVVVSLAALVLAIQIFRPTKSASTPPLTTGTPITPVPTTTKKTVSMQESVTPVALKAITPESSPTPLPTGDGSLLIERPVPAITAEIDGKIDWNEQLVIDGWIEIECLAPGVRCYYNQSAVGKTQTVENIQVKPGAAMIFGGYEIYIQLKDPATGKTQTISRSKGAYGVVPAGLTVEKLVTTDGFTVMLDSTNAQLEYCARIAQTYAEKWALSTTFPVETWKEPLCSGTYKVPVDSDRIHGGSLPYPSTLAPKTTVTP